MAREEISQSYLKTLCPELDRLPDGWIIKATPQSHEQPKRIFFQNPSGTTTFEHPTLGPLPRPWILRLCTMHDANPDPRTGKLPQCPKYFNRDTKVSTDEDPRFSAENLRARAQSLKHNDKVNIAGSIKKMKPGMKLEDMKRQDIGTRDIRADYDILKAIDPGDGSIGGMNSGVFVVRLKKQNRLSVEKRFKKDGVSFGVNEIKMLHRVRHASLTFYTAGFVTPDLRKASVYVEFCDRGSLDDLITEYSKRSINTPRPLPPERFVWHAFAGLCDGLAYLMGGKSYISENETDYSAVPGWTPILHRDIKPDNVLLRSRDTLGSNRYFYCVLSDFGLACEDRPDNHPNVDRHQKVRAKLGTKAWWAPELLYSPYPRTDNEQYYFPTPYRHNVKTDLWSLGACIFNLAECRSYDQNRKPMPGTFAHMKMYDKPSGLDMNTFMEGAACRVKELTVSSRFSTQLRVAVQYATNWNQTERPHAVKMVKALKKLIRDAGYMDGRDPSESEKLPKWATRVHDYHSRTPLDPRQFNSS